MILLSVVVLIGMGILLDRMSRGTTITFRADELISTLQSGLVATDAPSSTPAPQSTIKTTAVTIAPVQDAYGEQAQPSATPATHTFTMTIGGLMGFHSDISDSAYDAQTGMFDYASIVDTLAYSVYSDINIVTLNNLLTLQGAEYADVNTVPETLDALKKLGIDYALLNHGRILDKGEEGLNATAQHLNTAGIAWGGVDNVDAQGQVKLISLNGAQIAILGYAEAVSTKTKEEAEMTGRLTLLDAARVGQDIALARKQGADFVMVSLHWGKSDAGSVTEYQRELAHQIAEYGADLIVGTGTDAVLPIEMIETVDAKGRMRQTLTAYSLGTLLSEKRDTRAQVSGMMLNMRLTVNMEEDYAHYDAITYTPTYVWKQEMAGKIIFRILPSQMAAPDGMIQRQQEIMGRALTLIDDVMASGPAVRREQ